MMACRRIYATVVCTTPRCTQISEKMCASAKQCCTILLHLRLWNTIPKHRYRKVQSTAELHLVTALRLSIHRKSTRAPKRKAPLRISRTLQPQYQWSHKMRKWTGSKHSKSKMFSSANSVIKRSSTKRNASDMNCITTTNRIHTSVRFVRSCAHRETRSSRTLRNVMIRNRFYVRNATKNSGDDPTYESILSFIPAYVSYSSVCSFGKN